MYPRLINQIVKAIDGKKGENIKVYNVKGKSPLYDYVVVCTALNEKNMGAIASSVEDTLEEQGFNIKNIEGRDSADWVIIDCYDAIVHVLTEQYRDHLKLDDLLTKRK